MWLNHKTQNPIFGGDLRTCHSPTKACDLLLELNSSHLRKNNHLKHLKPLTQTCVFSRNLFFVSATVFKHILGARNQLWAWLPEVDSRVLINWLRVFTKVYLSLQTSILKSGKCKNTRSSSVCPWPTTQRAHRWTVCVFDRTPCLWASAIWA
jgi:hypothetical protein